MTLFQVFLTKMSDFFKSKSHLVHHKGNRWHTDQQQGP